MLSNQFMGSKKHHFIITLELFSFFSSMGMSPLLAAQK
jgi:hypothetical protein